MNDPGIELLAAVRALARTGIDDQTLGRTVRELLTGTTAVASPAFQRRELVPLKIRLPDGQATNITVPRALLDAAAQALGGERQARQKARDLAVCAPGTNNRSGWVQDQLARLVHADGGIA